MRPATAAETMTRAMIDVAKEKAATGDYPEAIRTITVFIESIENNDDKTRRAFGSNLVPLYCLRAKVHFEAGNPSGDATKLEMAREDVRKAAEALDQFYEGIDPIQKESVRASINNVISADEKLRNDSISVVLQMGTAVLTHAGKAVASGQSAAKPGQVFLVRAGCFLLGAVLWLLSFYLLFGVSVEAPSPGFPLLLGFASQSILASVAAKGWDRYFVDRWGHPSTLYKILVVLVLTWTGIGLLWVSYWTGKGLLRLVFRV